MHRVHWRTLIFGFFVVATLLRAVNECEVKQKRDNAVIRNWRNLAVKPDVSGWLMHPE